MDRIIYELPFYKPDNFVGRTEITTEIKAQVGLIDNKKPDKRVYIIQGQRGVGKSWLLAHVKNDLCQECNHKFYLFGYDFGKYLRNHRPDDETVVTELLDLFRQQITPTINMGITLAESSRAIERALREIKTPLVILLDTVYEIGWSTLKLIERYFLEMIIANANSFIIMTGRGRPYPWKILEIRLHSKSIGLMPFVNEEETLAQLTRQNPAAESYSAEIHELTKGDPMGNFLLAKVYGNSPLEAINTVNGLDMVIDHKLDIITDSKDRQIIRDCIEAVSVLKSFDAERLLRMLAQYNSDKYQTIDDKTAQSYLNLLLEYAFAQWSKEQHGYQLDYGTQRFCRQYLKQKYKENIDDTWKRLQCEAYKIFQDWLTQYARQKEMWQGEKDDHANHLRQFEINPEDSCVLPESSSN